MDMSVTLFISIVTIGGAGVTALLTEAIKTWYRNAGKECSANAIALINAIIIGAGGTAVVYMLNDIHWTVNNIICLVMVVFVEWLISMVGFDKVSQLLNQISQLVPKKKEEKTEEDNK